MKVLTFGAIWCPACLVMKPRWEKIQAELSWLDRKHVDIDENPKITKKYQVINPPVFIFFDKNNKEFSRMTGEVSRKKLIKFLEENREK